MPQTRNKLYHSSEAAKPAQSVPGKRSVNRDGRGLAYVYFVSRAH
jgi:hypothetical protein